MNDDHHNISYEFDSNEILCMLIRQVKLWQDLLSFKQSYIW